MNKLFNEKKFIFENNLPIHIVKEIVSLLVTDEEIREIDADEMFKYIEDHPEISWCWRGISQNPNVTMQYVEEHPEYKWCWYGISKYLFSHRFAEIVAERLLYLL